MSTLRWRCVPYERPLPKPIQTAHGIYRVRSGFLIQVTDDDGAEGLGDVAPLSGFSRETAADIRDAWAALSVSAAGWRIPGDRTELEAITSEFGSEFAPYPSLQFGIETALADCAARACGLPLSGWLNAQAASRVFVNGLISEQDQEAAVAALRAQYRNGYRCFKVKAGVDRVDGVDQVNRDMGRIRALCEAFDDVAIRVDVNGGWTAEQLRAVCEGLAGVSLEFLEQPLPSGQAEAARAITRAFGIPLALDEEVASIDIGLRLLHSDLCDVIVVKPMMVGGLTGTLRLAEAAAVTGKRIVITSAWESDVGVAAALHLSAACGDVAATAGLSTAGMIAEGLVAPPLRIDNAALAIDERPGLGLRLDSNISGQLFGHP